MTDQSESTDLMTVSDDDLRRGGLPDNMKMAPGLAIYFVESLYQRSKAVAVRMSQARGFVGAHLIDNPSACMAILSRAITWNLDPFAVAQSTYEVSGKIGYEGKLCQAILENSGAIQGRVEFEFFGPWENLRGKFRMVDAGPGKGKKPEQLWADEAEEGLGLIVRAHVKGEAEPREEEFFLSEMWPRNSTLWILRPKQQMRYACVRAFGNIATPGIFMGIPFDIDPTMMGQGGPVDITPSRPIPENEFSRSAARDPAMGDWVEQLNAAQTVGDVATIRAAALKALPPDMRSKFEEIADNRSRMIADAPVKTSTEKPPVADQKPEEEEAEQVETPMERGKRLLGVIKAPGEVQDLRDSLAEELPVAAERKTWANMCQVRFAELGGTGYLPKLKGSK